MRTSESPSAPAPSDTSYRAYVERQVNEIARALTKVMFGDFAAVARTADPDDTFGSLCAMVNVAINAARNAQRELRAANAGLEDRARELTARNRELSAAQEALVAAARRDVAAAMQARFVKQLIKAQEDERRRLSLELHDEAGQALTGLTLQLEAMKSADPETVPAAIAKCQSICRTLVEELRNISYGLHPLMLEQLGLPSAIEALMGEIGSGDGIDAVHEIDDGGHGWDIEPFVATTIYRIAQESLSNVRKHAEARSVRLTLARDATTIKLNIANDGCGFDADNPQANTGLGLPGMRERAELLGGKFTVQSRKGAGSEIAVEVPLTS